MRATCTLCVRFQQALFCFQRFVPVLEHFSSKATLNLTSLRHVEWRRNPARVADKRMKNTVSAAKKNVRRGQIAPRQGCLVRLTTRGTAPWSERGNLWLPRETPIVSRSTSLNQTGNCIGDWWNRTIVLIGGTVN